MGPVAENVRECLGGPQCPSEPPLRAPFCDPLLNYQQSIEIALSLKDILKGSEKDSKVPSDGVVSR